MTTVAGHIISEHGDPLWDEPIYTITVTTAWTKKKNPKRKRGWAEMPMICAGPDWLSYPIGLIGAN